jgi:hypothetical protein
MLQQQQKLRIKYLSGFNAGKVKKKKKIQKCDKDGWVDAHSSLQLLVLLSVWVISGGSHI